MDPSLLQRMTAYAESHRGLLLERDLEGLGIDGPTKYRLLRQHRLEWFGTHTLRIPGSPPSWEQKLLAAVTDFEPDGYVSHHATAALLEFDRCSSGSVDVVVPRGRSVRHPWATVHTTARPVTAIDRMMIDGLPSVTASRCIIQLAARVDHETLAAFIGSALRDGWSAEPFLRRRLMALRGRGVPGVRALDAALAWPIGQSELERAFLDLVRRAQLPTPRLQVTYRRDGKHVARVDAEFPGDEIVELQGHAHHSTREQRARDAQRHAELRMMGKRVTELTFEQVMERADWVLTVLRTVLRAA